MPPACATAAKTVRSRVSMVPLLLPPPSRNPMASFMINHFSRSFARPNLVWQRQRKRSGARMAANEFLRRLGIACPIIQGPMGGGPSTPELVAAVSNAGGPGPLGAAHLMPDQNSGAVRGVKAPPAPALNGKPVAGPRATGQA